MLYGRGLQTLCLNSLSCEPVFSMEETVSIIQNEDSSTFLPGRQYTFTSKTPCPTRFSKLRKFPSFLAQLLRRVALCLLIRHVNGFPLREKLWKHMKIYWISIIMEVPLNSVIILKRRFPTVWKSAVSNAQPFCNCTDTLQLSFCLGSMNLYFFSQQLFILDITLTWSQRLSCLCAETDLFSYRTFSS